MSEVDALQTVLAAEHAAVYVLGALGGQTSASAQPALFAALQDAHAAHRDRRDQVVARLQGLGASPVPAEPAYELPPDLGTVAAVTTRARELEAGCASTYGFLVGSTTGALRRWAVEALTDAAVRGLGFGAAPEILPGS
ncbi:ferritin-like domain-containing protein [Nocardioides sp. W7]|uniref:ferritin-like domain-containing protein n=1 Tax=Nocardioides sp. W7 TaxID=2931390 RepID=UPI001FD47BE1|nr:ferritin-like domain-containing protein [Nocardioides sp. W7]